MNDEIKAVKLRSKERAFWADGTSKCEGPALRKKQVSSKNRIRTTVLTGLGREWWWMRSEREMGPDYSGFTGHTKLFKSDMTWLKVYKDHPGNGGCCESS